MKGIHRRASTGSAWDRLAQMESTNGSSSGAVGGVQPLPTTPPTGASISSSIHDDICKQATLLDASIHSLPATASATSSFSFTKPFIKRSISSGKRRHSIQTSSLPRSKSKSPAPKRAPAAEENNKNDEGDSADPLMSLSSSSDHGTPRKPPSKSRVSTALKERSASDRHLLNKSSSSGSNNKSVIKARVRRHRSSVASASTTPKKDRVSSGTTPKKERKVSRRRSSTGGSSKGNDTNSSNKTKQRARAPIMAEELLKTSDSTSTTTSTQSTSANGKKDARKTMSRRHSSLGLGVTAESSNNVNGSNKETLVSERKKLKKSRSFIESSSSTIKSPRAAPKRRPSKLGAGGSSSRSLLPVPTADSNGKSSNATPVRRRNSKLGGSSSHEDSVNTTKEAQHHGKSPRASPTRQKTKKVQGGRSNSRSRSKSPRATPTRQISNRAVERSNSSSLRHVVSSGPSSEGTSSKSNNANVNNQQSKSMGGVDNDTSSTTSVSSSQNRAPLKRRPSKNLSKSRSSEDLLQNMRLYGYNNPHVSAPSRSTSFRLNNNSQPQRRFSVDHAPLKKSASFHLPASSARRHSISDSGIDSTKQQPIKSILKKTSSFDKDMLSSSEHRFDSGSRSTTPVLKRSSSAQEFSTMSAALVSAPPRPPQRSRDDVVTVSDLLPVGPANAKQPQRSTDNNGETTSTPKENAVSNAKPPLRPRSEAIEYTATKTATTSATTNEDTPDMPKKESSSLNAKPSRRSIDEENVNDTTRSPKNRERSSSLDILDKPPRDSRTGGRRLSLDLGPRLPKHINNDRRSNSDHPKHRYASMVDIHSPPRSPEKRPQPTGGRARDGVDSVVPLPPPSPIPSARRGIDSTVPLPPPSPIPSAKFSNRGAPDVAMAPPPPPTLLTTPLQPPRESVSSKHSPGTPSSSSKSSSSKKHGVSSDIVVEASGLSSSPRRSPKRSSRSPSGKKPSSSRRLSSSPSPRMSTRKKSASEHIPSSSPRASSRKKSSSEHSPRSSPRSPGRKKASSSENHLSSPSRSPGRKQSSSVLVSTPPSPRSPKASTSDHMSTLSPRSPGRNKKSSSSSDHAVSSSSKTKVETDPETSPRSPPNSKKKKERPTNKSGSDNLDSSKPPSDKTNTAKKTSSSKGSSKKSSASTKKCRKKEKKSSSRRKGKKKTKKDATKTSERENEPSRTMSVSQSSMPELLDALDLTEGTFDGSYPDSLCDDGEFYDDHPDDNDNNNGDNNNGNDSDSDSTIEFGGEQDEESEEDEEESDDMFPVRALPLAPIVTMIPPPTDHSAPVTN